MAKTTRTTKANGNVTVLDPPEPPIPPVPEPEPADSGEEEEEETETRFQETAAAPEIDKRRGRGHHKEASAGFFARISAFPRAEWEKLLLYIYRLAPITDRRASGEPVNYIAKLSEPIDEDYVLKEPNWGGSGKYRVRLNRTNADGKNTPVDVVEFVVENEKYPPRVAPGEWVDDPRNRRWAWAKTYYDGKQPPPAAPPAQAPAGPTITELIQGVKELKELSKEAAPPTPPAAPDPAEQFAKNVDSVAKIVEMAKPAAPPAPDTSLQKFILDRLAASEERANKLMDRLLMPTTTPATTADPLAVMAIDLLKKRLERMDEKPDPETATERASRMNGTQELIAEITKHVAPVLDKAMGLFTVMAAAKQVPPRHQPRPPATVDVAATNGTQQPEQPQQPEPAAQPQQEPPQQPTMEQAQQQILNFVLGNATPTLMHYLENSDGESFAAWFCDTAFSLPGVPPPFNRLSGVDAHKFAKQFGCKQIIEAYKKNPTLYQQIAPNTEAEEKFIRFLDEFLAYDPEAEGDEDGTD